MAITVSFWQDIMLSRLSKVQRCQNLSSNIDNELIKIPIYIYIYMYTARFKIKAYFMNYDFKFVDVM